MSLIPAYQKPFQPKLTMHDDVTVNSADGAPWYARFKSLRQAPGDGDGVTLHVMVYKSHWPDVTVSAMRQDGAWAIVVDRREPGTDPEEATSNARVVLAYVPDDENLPAEVMIPSKGVKGAVKD